MIVFEVCPLRYPVSLISWGSEGNEGEKVSLLGTANNRRPSRFEGRSSGDGEDMANGCYGILTFAVLWYVESRLGVFDEAMEPRTSSSITIEPHDEEICADTREMRKFYWEECAGEWNINMKAGKPSWGERRVIFSRNNESFRVSMIVRNYSPPRPAVPHRLLFIFAPGREGPAATGQRQSSHVY